MIMKIVKIILSVAIIFSFINCHAQKEEKVTNKPFQVFLDKFKTIDPPINYKRLENRSKEMTKEEAITFLHKTQKDLVFIIEEMGEDDIMYTSEENYVPRCKFKYQLTDNIYMLCTLESSGASIVDSSLVVLRSYTKGGGIIDKCVIGGQFAYNERIVSCVLYDKNHIRIFHYNDDYTRKDEGFFSTVYYINYIITDDGQFIRKDKSDITYLKDNAIQYSTYDPSMKDDPMNEYGF